MENMNLDSLMNMVKNLSGTMNTKVEEWKEKLATLTCEGIAGGGNVRILINGQYKIQKLHIEPEFLNQEHKILLQETIIAAYNNAHDLMKEKIKTFVQEQSGGLNLPFEGLF